MPTSVYYSKQNKTSYVYETEYYYDKEAQRTKSRKKLIGKIDPETGNMIPTGKKGRAPKPKTEPTNYNHTDEEYDDLLAKFNQVCRELQEKEAVRIELDKQLRATKRALREYKKRVHETIAVLYNDPELDAEDE
ncbi:MAG: hypothetical protein LUD50_01135 [Clostridia bacterium]|nr:hypothetical protein [Clostridia bacterium]